MHQNAEAAAAAGRGPKFPRVSQQKSEAGRARKSGHGRVRGTTIALPVKARGSGNAKVASRRK